MNSFLENFFKLEERQTNWRREVIGGITTFVTMSYIIFVNPQIMAAAGMEAGAVMIATCLATAVGTLFMALYANAPLAQAPVMGVNAFFAYTLCGSMGYTWEQGLGAVLLSGFLLLIISVTGLRKKIIEEIPFYLKKAIGIGIGFFILYIGLKNADLLSFTAGAGSFELVDGSARISGGIIPSLNFGSDTALLSLLGVLLNLIFLLRDTRGGILLSMVLTSVIGCLLQFFCGWQLGITLPGAMPIGNIDDVFGKALTGFVQLFDISQGIGPMLVSLVVVAITLTFADLFNTIGMILATVSKANMIDEQGNIVGSERMLVSDAVATVLGAIIGTSTVSIYVESSAGIATGARTGLASVVTAALFAVSVVLAPLLGLVPVAATAPVLIIVGILMAAEIGDIDWRNMDVAVPSYFTIVMMCFGYNIADGIAFGFIMFCFVQLVRGRFNEVTWLIRILTALFLLRFAIMLTY